MLGIVGKVVFQTPAYFHQFSVGVVHNLGDLSGIAGQRFVKDVSNFQFHRVASIRLPNARFWGWIFSCDKYYYRVPQKNSIVMFLLKLRFLAKPHDQF